MEHTVWKGPRAPGSNPYRPWWTLEQVQSNLAPVPGKPAPLMFTFRRRDGAHSSIFQVTGGPQMVKWPDKIDDEIAYIDRHNPLPTPAPTPLQVWTRVLPTGELQASAVLDTIWNEEKNQYAVLWPGACEDDEQSTHILYEEEDWPEPGTLLISGYGAPWAPPEYGQELRVMVPQGDQDGEE